MIKSRSAFAGLVLAVAVMATSLAGCAPTVNTNHHAKPKFHLFSVVQHTAPLTLAPGQTASATASCASGEILVSGGFSTNDAQKGASQGAFASYPSNSAGAPPSTQGQAENSWTVRAVNPNSEEVDYQVSVNCASGLPITSAIWYQPLTLVPNLGYGTTVYCADAPTSILVGGGFERPEETAHTLYLAQATLDWGVDSQGWWVIGGGGPGGTAFAVCAKGKDITAEPPVWTTQDTFNQLDAGQYQSDKGVSCDPDELVVGGGFYIWYDWNVTWPLSDNSLKPNSPQQWRIGYNSTGVPTLVGEAPQPKNDGIEAICILATPPTTPSHGKIIHPTFSNYHHLLRIPADVTVATDGSGQIRAGKLIARVTQTRSKAIAALKTINPFTGGVSYTVPSGCGSPVPAIDAASSVLTSQLGRSVPSGQIAFGSPAISVNRDSLTCSPAAGTQRTAPFTYTQAIDATATQGTYDPTSIVTYQQNQLLKGTQALGGPYVLRDTLLCQGGPKLLRASSTRATLQCAAYGVAEWPWSTDQLRALAQSLAGKTKDESQRILDTLPGIVAGSAVIANLHGNKLPSNASDITIILVRPQDTAPVIRAP